MVIAVLEAHAGLKLGQHDIYLNVAGGLRITEPAADVAAAAALVSSLRIAASPDRVYMGEIGGAASGQPVQHRGSRKPPSWGFQSALAPAPLDTAGPSPIRWRPPQGDVADLVAGVASGKRPGGGRRPRGQ